MLTNKLSSLLIKHNLVIEKKISKEIFEQRQNAIIRLFQNAGYENVDRNLVLFLCYFNGKQISHKGHIIEFNLANMMTHFPHNEVAYLEKLTEKQLVAFGTMQSGWYDLFADDKGAVYAIHIERDEQILYGENPFVALENILQETLLQTKSI